MDKTLISFRGNRDLWLDFTHQVRKNKTEVWEVLEPVLKQYVKKK